MIRTTFGNGAINLVNGDGDGLEFKPNDHIRLGESTESTESNESTESTSINQPIRSRVQGLDSTHSQMLILATTIGREPPTNGINDVE